jgi:hypothetical protein
MWNMNSEIIIDSMNNPFFKSSMPMPQMQVPQATGPGCGGCAQNQINQQVSQMNQMAEMQRKNFSQPGSGGFNRLFE